MDDALLLSTGIAHRKAYTSAVMRMPTEALQNRLKDPSRTFFFESVRDVGTAGGGVSLWAGGAGGIPICSADVSGISQQKPDDTLALPQLPAMPPHVDATSMAISSCVFNATIETCCSPPQGWTAMPTPMSTLHAHAHADGRGRRRGVWRVVCGGRRVPRGRPEGVRLRPRHVHVRGGDLHLLPIRMNMRCGVGTRALGSRLAPW